MSESNKVPIQATPEQQASMAASGLVGSLFTPGAAAGTHGSSQGHGTAPTSISAVDVEFGAAFVGLGGVQTVCVAGAVPGTFLPTYLRRRWLGTGAQSPGR